MILAAGIILLTVLVFAPQVWVRHVLARYDAPIEQLPGTGGELAAHLVREFGLKDVKVEISRAWADHYDPGDKSIRLSPAVFHGKSFTAITVSAHEVGHAIQHQVMYTPLLWRWRMARYVSYSETLAALILLAFPFVILVTHLPYLGIAMLLGGIGILLLPVLFHLLTLPVELDASFRRALPVLIDGGYIPASAVPIARRILTAAALTYVSASLSSLLNFYRWVAMLRR
jgi:Zn-dependent membrane protease YugP